MSLMSTHLFDFNDQIILITGAARGIGYGLCEYFGKLGATVCLAVRKKDSVKATERAFEKVGGRGFVFNMDVSKPGEVDRGFALVEKKFGRLDVLVNNAGDGANAPALEESVEQFDRVMATNVRGTFLCSQAAGRMMVKRKYGRIVNISSQAGVVAIANHAAYAASKGAINMLTKVMALEWAPFGVTVNAVGPTFIYTPGTAERLDTPAFRKSVVARIPVGDVGQIEDVASAVAFLASPAARMITGELLLVDGGWTIQ